MVSLNQASIYHWLNRPDCEPKRLSIGRRLAYTQFSAMQPRPVASQKFASLIVKIWILSIGVTPMRHWRAQRA